MASTRYNSLKGEEVMATCFEVANYFLYKIDPEVGDTISNLKLQKLVYYAQGFALALFDKPLFSSRIEAWDHGPVIPDLYHEYKQHKAGNIPPIEKLNKTSLTEDQIALLDEVYEVFGQFSAWALRNMTHREPPWNEAADDEVIPHEDMKKYFKTRIEQ